ncbi:HAD-superfamily hydrolase [Hypoxylon cercidicola]|nr:HAD-superfamily hydrolase [Hypoxylon cercidicola]
MTPAKERTVAFAFDIDGVLVKGKKPVPGARETIQLLQSRRIPFIFLTNGGGHTEEAHVAKLGQRLELTLHAKQFVQSHTPFLDLVPAYGDKTVLVLGGHGQQIRNLAHAYGFTKVVTSSDVVAECEHIHPFPEMTKDHHVEHGRGNGELRATKISAIMVWTSPRDWCLDLQVVTDLLLSDGGIIGTRSPTNGDSSLPNNGYQQEDQPKLFFCNPDFEWSTEHEHPRFAQGAFREALRGVWNHATRGRAQLEYEVVGKPTEATYKYGERVLREYGEALDASRTIDTVYMVGDNPESDIVGANSFRSEHGIVWKSILVETGVHVANSVSSHQPYHTATDVKEAVEWVLEEEDAIAGCSRHTNGNGAAGNGKA